MKEHEWSRPIGVYETISGVMCRNCGGSIITGEPTEIPSDEDYESSGLPRDCEKAILVVIHEEYKPFTKEDCWNDADWPPKWPDNSESPELGKSNS